MMFVKIGYLYTPLSSFLCNFVYKKMYLNESGLSLYDDIARPFRNTDALSVSLIMSVDKFQMQNHPTDCDDT
jgi:hypothetical protein